VADYKGIWSSPEGRHLLVNPADMTMHVLKLEPGPPPPSFTPEQVASMRPLDWASAPRIAGPQNLPALAEGLVAAAWDRVWQVALIFINAPDQWPARTSFHAQAAARGTTLAPQGGDTSLSPIETLGLTGGTVARLSKEIRANGKFTTLEDLTKRVREASGGIIKRAIAEKIAQELAAPSRMAMFFAHKDGKVKFRDVNAARAAEPAKDAEDEGPAAGRYPPR
jgi:hypothetical protein